MPAEDLILNGKAKLGNEVRLLWRDELSTLFSRQIVFGDDGKPTSGICTAVRSRNAALLVGK